MLLVLLVSKVIFWFVVCVVIYLDGPKSRKIILVRALWLEIWGNVAGMLTLAFAALLGIKLETVIAMWVAGAYLLFVFFFFCLWYLVPGTLKNNQSLPH